MIHQHVSPLRFVLLSYFVLYLTLYAAGGEWTLVHQEWPAVDPAFLFIWLSTPWVIVLLIQGSLRTPLKPELSEVLSRNLAPLLIFVGMAVISVVYSVHPTANWTGGGKYILALGFDCLVFGLGMALPAIPSLRRNLRVCAQAALLVLLGTVMADVATPETFSVHAARASGLAVNPNRASLMIIMLLALSIQFDRISKVDCIYIVLSAFAVIMTMSRAGLLHLGILLIAYSVSALRSVKTGKRKLLTGAICFAVAAVLSVPLWRYAVDEGDLFTTQYTNSRTLMFTGETEIEWFDELRFGVLADGVELVQRSPLSGHGTGYWQIHEVGWHNMYLRMAVDNGLPGLALYLAFLCSGLFILIKRGDVRGVFMVTMWVVDSFFNHNLIDNRGALLILGIVFSMSCIPKDEAPPLSGSDARGRVPGSAPDRVENGFASSPKN